MTALRLDGVTVEVGGRRLIDAVDLEVPDGTWLTIAGANGAGKTTLLRAAAGLQPATGRIDLANTPLRSLGRRQRARAVALVPQTATIPPGLPVRDYVMLGRTSHLPVLGRESASDFAAVDEALERLDLTPFADRVLETLSGGELQRVVLARAIAQEAPLLLLDEPTSALDVGHQQDVLDLVDDLRQRLRLTVVATMHDLTLTAQYSDRIVLLDGGRVAAAGAPAEVLTGNRLSALYDARVDVLEHRGALVIVPHRRFDAADDPGAGTEPPAVVPEAVPEPEATAPEAAQAVPTEEPVPPALRRAPSLLLVNTGDGKGKSTAAIGVVVRGVARGWRVGVVQFVKSEDWNSGEATVARELGVDWWTLGEGFTWDSDDLGRDEAAARSAWERARGVITAGEHRLVVLDEVTYPVNWGWIDGEEVLAVLRDRPAHVNVVCTGRDAPAALVEAADTVTDMRAVKHAYQRGIRAKKGIDY